MNPLRIVVKALIEQNGKILVLKRSNNDKFRPGEWDLPGGKAKLNEDKISAMKREILEELFVECDVGETFSHYFMAAKDMDKDCDRDYYILHVTLLSDKIKLSKAHTEFKWLNKKEAFELLPDFLHTNQF